jgi:aminocarboxymuconate-semialdehyde decarboxylase
VTVFDLHAHSIVPTALPRMVAAHPEFAPILEENGSERILKQKSGGVQKIPPGLFEPEIRIAAMEGQGVDMQVLSLLTSQLNYDLDPEVGTAFASIQNDSLIELATEMPDRFAVFAHLPLQDVQGSLAEIKRLTGFPCVRGVYIATNVRGENLDLPALEPIWAALEAADLPIWVHPDHRSLKNLKRIQDYYLQNNIGNPLDTTIAIAIVIHSGILERYPRLRFGFSHGGGFAAYQIRRWDDGWEKHAVARRFISRPPSSYFENLYFDTLAHEASLRLLAQHVGWGQIVVGSDYPMSMGTDDPLFVVRALQLPKADERRVLSENAEKFMRKV